MLTLLTPWIVTAATVLSAPDHPVRLCLVLAPASPAATRAATPASNAGKLTCRRSTRKLRTVRRGRPVVPMFALENSGDEELVIEHIEASAADVAFHLRAGRHEIPLPDDPDVPIGKHVAPGDIIHLGIQIATDTLDGPQQRTITVRYVTPDPKGPTPGQIDLSIEFTVTDEVAKPPPKPKPKPTPKPVVEPTGPQPKMVASEVEVDLGEVTAGEKKSHTFVIRNEGEAPLQVANIKTKCGCALSRTVFLEKEEVDFDRLEGGASYVKVKPGKEFSIRLVVDATTTREGPLEEKITVFTNDPVQPEVVFRATANVSRGFAIEPKALVFSPVPKGQELHGRVELELTRLDGCRVTAVRSPEPYIQARLEELAPPGAKTPARYAVDVTITGEAPGGKLLRWLQAVTTHERVKEIKIPITAQIIPNITFTTANKTDPEMIDFGMISSSEPIVRDVEIVNTDKTSPYHIKGIEVHSAQADLIEVQPITIDDGLHYRLKVTLLRKPDARMIMGSIVVTSDHVDMPVKEIRFRGWVTRK